ncbi:MAG: MerR family transcriptional regulator [Gemmatimonadetes bacterium]|nr:MerR family transcriptional regulator [Gemmatimonadota bacterium]NIO31537.1 MerR family transcriptional regulator [Gemmatimonadota bacterium]
MNRTQGSLSIREISRRTGVPESTLRYYRSLFPEYIPTLGSGRKRRHPEGAVNVFLRIASLFANGETRGTVRRELQGGPPPAERGERSQDGETSVELTRALPVEVAEPPGRLAPQELEQLLAAMLVRDRELVTMHRDLLELLEKLIHTLGSLAGSPAWNYGDRLEPAIPPPRQEPAIATRGRSDSEEQQTPGGPLELERLRDSLQRERETVERLRRARLELEQRLARLEREEGKGERRKRR